MLDTYNVTLKLPRKAFIKNQEHKQGALGFITHGTVEKGKDPNDPKSWRIETHFVQDITSVKHSCEFSAEAVYRPRFEKGELQAYFMYGGYFEMPSAIATPIFYEDNERPLVEPKFLNTPDGKPLKKATVTITKKTWNGIAEGEPVPIVIGPVGDLL